jgi:dephospho-CoA kinase
MRYKAGMSSPYVIALTGGVASGKTSVASCFERLGVVVADADLAAREAVAFGSAGLAEVVAAFGAGMLDAAGNLDRAAMRRLVFADVDARKRLEAIVHPRVRALLQAACATAAGAYAIAAIPLLAEGGGRDAYPWLDRILVVDVPVELQRERLRQRDGIDAALADRMIDAQATRQQRLAMADDVVINDTSLEALAAHADALHALYLRLAASAER